MLSTTATRKSLRFIHDEVEFLPHQIEGVRELARRSSFILADEMGLGKTAQALTIFAIDVERGVAKRLLVVCPATLKANWEEEVAKFTKFRSHTLDGSPKQRSKQITEFNVDILIVNYEQVVAHLTELNDLEFDAIIYDEAHYLKNPKAGRTKACHGLRARRHMCLTGSPMLNRPNELWSLLYRTAPHDFPKYWSFVNRYVVYGGYENKQVIGVKNERELNSKLNTVMLRRLKKNVLDLPEKQHIQIQVDLSPEQRKMYQEAKDEMRLTMPDLPGPLDMENALVRFLRLKQICGTPACFGSKDISWKLDRVIDDTVALLDSGEKVVIFTQFRGVLAALCSRLASQKALVWNLSGDTPMAERVPTVNNWRDHPSPGVIVCMLQVAGVGLNMTAARHALFADKLFVPKLNEQAEDRLHRIGADKSQPVQIREYITRRTIESRIEQILKTKKRMFDTVVETSDYKKALYEAMKEEDDA